MNRLTAQQAKALDLERHVSVTANAGSGKTRVLVERFVSAVESGIDIGRILCLTFTEKAALELRDRIGARLTSELSGVLNRKAAPEREDLLREAKRKMLEANISTIHSFCSQVLREFPVEAGVDASFKVLEDFDSSSLKQEASDEAVRESLKEERLGGARSSSAGSVHDLLVRMGYRKTVRLLVDLLDNREKIEHIKLRRESILIENAGVTRDWTVLTKAVVTVALDNLMGEKGTIADELDLLRRFLQEGSIEIGQVLATLRGLLAKILTKEGTPRKRAISIEDGSEYSAENAAAVLELAFMSSGGPGDDTELLDYETYLALSRALVVLHERSNSIYSRKKYLMGALDFDDLQILAIRLLKANAGVSAALASRFEQIMVDEFQDTNFLQYDIFMTLVSNLEGNAKFFVVGDPKQSIYRFRNAQVEVSEKAGKDTSGRADGLLLSLSETFRMNAGLAAFVNAIFSKVMTGTGPARAAGLPFAGDTRYDNLVATRPAGDGFPVELYIWERNHSGDAVEDAGTDQENGPDNIESQSLFVAARIRQMLDSGETIRTVRDDERSRKIRFGDIAILLRSRSRLAVLEEALTECNIPYNVSSGIGFYSAQEIYDLTSYLTFLLDNDSDIDLLTVLRSPLFGISENELYGISRSGGEHLYTKLQNESLRSTSEEVRYAATVLAGEIQLCHKLTIPELLNRILERTGWLAAFRQSPTSDQRLANLRKLLEIAREFESRGFSNLFDFVERLKYLADAAREGQAPVEEDSDSVKIMTVHAAKGLEFPVVVVPFCEARTVGRERTIINDRVGVLPDFGKEFLPTPMKLYSELEKLGEQAEIGRLFYVACTRAMDKLILSTSAKKTERRRGIRCFTDILGRSLDLSGCLTERHFILPDVQVLVHNTIPSLPRKESSSEKITEEPELHDIYLDPIPAYVGGEIYSATLLQTFKLCPTKYFLTYRLGMTGLERNFKPEVNEEYTDVILSTVKGQIIHSVLQKAVADGKMEEVSVGPSVENAISVAGVSGFSVSLKEDLRNRVTENVMNAIMTLKKLAPLDKVFVEQTITRKIGSDFLTGTLDLLVTDESGYHVFDYKTNRLEKGTEKIYSDYEIQMKLYALLCSDLKPQQNEFDATIIFTREPGKFLRKVYSRNELAVFEQELRSMIDSIKKLETFDGKFPGPELLPTKSPHCNECEYYLAMGEKKCLMSRLEENNKPVPVNKAV